MNPLSSEMPINGFKAALTRHQTQIGLWLSSGHAGLAEMLAGTGYDWLLIDGEHGPNDLLGVLAQLQGVSSACASLPVQASRPHPVVRLPSADPVRVKQVMELGAQTLLIPMVDTPEQALAMAKAMRYPPEGSRGMGSSAARSSQWSRFQNYVNEANAQACLLVQVETVEALANIDAIALTPGVDGLFIGPADLSASMGYRGQANHPQVQAAITQAVERIHRAGKAAGILAMDEVQAKQWLAYGVEFVAVGIDLLLLSKAARQLRARFASDTEASLAG